MQIKKILSKDASILVPGHTIEFDLGQSHSKTLLRCDKNDLLGLSLLNYLFQLAHDTRNPLQSIYMDERCNAITGEDWSFSFVMKEWLVHLLGNKLCM